MHAVFQMHDQIPGAVPACAKSGPDNRIPGFTDAGPQVGSENWLVRFQPNPSARLRLFCFPYAGVGASAYFAWRGLHPGIELIVAQLPGRENRFGEAPLREMSAIVAELAEAIRPYSDRPCAFFGHSMGAVVGFELARRLHSEGLPGPVHLFVSGRPAPHRPELLPPIHDVPDNEFLEQIQRRWGNGIPKLVLHDPELLPMFLTILRADLAAIETYSNLEGRRLDCPITAFGGDEDPSVSPDDLCAWSVHTTGPFRWRMVSGGHFFIREQQQIIAKAVLEAIAPALKQ
jgi:surfactin synthase thioesterase subunit